VVAHGETLYEIESYWLRVILNDDGFERSGLTAISQEAIKLDFVFYFRVIICGHFVSSPRLHTFMSIVNHEIEKCCDKIHCI
jgi:hypothetical protein